MEMAVSTGVLVVIVGLSALRTCSAHQTLTTTSAVPAWPDQFSVNLEILVEQYGPKWNSSGVLYYDWKTKV